ncbi:MAG TPA: hypothetical protein VK116_07405, partial [Planctomycetota bacterium]|nr:hypothetical protein [Planctomycetota bacterium]
MTSPADPGADGPAAGDDFLFLRERVDDEEIASLFTEDPAALERAVRHLIDRARDDSRMEAALIDTLEIAVDEECDETLASSWIAVILGEAGSARAIEPLSRCLARE